MAAALPLCPPLGPTGFASSEWQRWFDTLRQRSNSSVQSGTAVTFSSLAVTGPFGCNGKAPQASVVLPANAVDLATAIALVNAIKAALIADGIGA